MSMATNNKPIKEDPIRLEILARALRENSPDEYRGMTIKQQVAELKTLSASFLETSYKWFVIKDAN